MLASALISHGGRPVLASPNNDDPLVYSKVWDELRRERSLRPSHVVDGGGDASQVETLCSKYERSLRPSHVDDGGGGVLIARPESFSVSQWKVTPPVESPLEITKRQLRRDLEDSEHVLTQDYRFKSFMWSLKYMTLGPQRHKAIEQFWKQIYEERPPEDDTLVIRSFVLNDFLEAWDELRRWEAPLSEWTHHQRAALLQTSRTLAVGSSHEVNRELSWMLPRCGRSRVNQIRVRALCRPSSNLGRNLSLHGGFSPHPIQQVQWTSVAVLPATRRRSLACTKSPPALRAVVRCSQVPHWGQTK
jgi:hypothetical protein